MHIDKLLNMDRQTDKKTDNNREKYVHSKTDKC